MGESGQSGKTSQHCYYEQTMKYVGHNNGVTRGY
uniref:Uncharacterized protein n=1 Tax=Ciona intestinalis TaxID=7719 RepID=H2XQ49_CIOIN